MAGAAAEALKTYQNAGQLNEQLRVETDTVSWMAETLNGSMRTPEHRFTFNGEQLYGEDGGALRDVFDDSIRAAQVIAAQNPSLSFELRRRLIERDELADMESLALGQLLTDQEELANTIVVVSDFPPELMDAKDDVGGYNASRKQTMLRIVMLLEDGSIGMISQSLDGSNRGALEAIYAALGKQPEQGELLSQRINLRLPPKWQPQLIGNLMDVYDRSMAQRLGGEWHAGIRQAANGHNVDTYRFAQHQLDLIEWFTNLKLTDPHRAEQLRYSLAAEVAERYEAHVNREQRIAQVLQGTPAKPEVFIDRRVVGSSHYFIEQRVLMSGRRANLRGKVFSGCGGTIRGGYNNENDDFSIENQLDGLGYGNKSGNKAGSDRYGSLTFKCPKNGCENKRQPDKLLTHCQKCGEEIPRC